MCEKHFYNNDVARRIHIDVVIIISGSDNADVRELLRSKIGLEHIYNFYECCKKTTFGAQPHVNLNFGLLEILYHFFGEFAGSVNTGLWTHLKEQHCERSLCIRVAEEMQIHDALTGYHEVHSLVRKSHYYPPEHQVVLSGASSEAQCKSIEALWDKVEKDNETDLVQYHPVR